MHFFTVLCAMECPNPIVVDNRAFVFGTSTPDNDFNCSTPSHDTKEHISNIQSILEPYNPDKPYLGKHEQTTMTLDELMQSMFERPNDYVKHGSYDMNPTDLCTILKQKHIVLLPSKRFCLVLLQYLTQQGLLQVTIKKT